VWRFSISSESDIFDRMLSLQYKIRSDHAVLDNLMKLPVRLERDSYRRIRDQQLDV